MSTLLLDPVGGIAGDMLLAALLDLDPGVGVDEGARRLRDELSALPVSGYALAAEVETRRGFRGVRVRVDVSEPQPARGLHDIITILERGALPPRVLDRAVRVFTALTDAEAHVHGSTRETVHVHEVGGVDAIVDVVGACLLLERLDIRALGVVGALPLGSGVVNSAHGPIPLPAPATLRLLSGFDVRFTGREGECVTPTGAAILAALAQRDAARPAVRLTDVGIGFGTRVAAPEDPPNFLRVLRTPAAGEIDEVDVLETVVDDGNPEWIGHLMDVVFAAGARDAWLEAVYMKKNRPGTKISVIAACGDGARLAEVLFRETSTIGIRLRRDQRFVLPRRDEVVSTSAGDLPFKVVTLPDGTERATPEFEACRRVARETGRALRDVYAWAADEWRRTHPSPASGDGA
jgi:uncharacterized protein (TIGR00299 family) protein